MKNQTIGFIGGGRVTRILLGGWRHAQALPAKVVVSEPNAEVRAKLQAEFPSIEISPADNRQAAAQAVVFLAVHPPAVMTALADLAGALDAESLLVSLVPKFTLARLAVALGGHARIARVIPNAPSIIGAGFNPLTFSPGLSAAAQAELKALLAPLGDCPDVAEPTLEAYALLAAMGPTYFWFQLQALRDLAAGLGLSETDANVALKRMICGAARTLVDSDLSPAEVMDLVPIKPLAEMEPSVLEFYRTRLPALYQKIKP